MAEDLRHSLDVMEGVKCLVYGRPKKIPSDKLGLYVTYASKYLHDTGKNEDGSPAGKYELHDEDNELI